MNTSEILNNAADLIEEYGWQRGPGSMYGEGGVCAMGAIYASLVGGIAKRTQGENPYETANECPAGQAMVEYLADKGFAAAGWPETDHVWRWNDSYNQTATNVVEVLRACAVIEASRERESVEAQ